MKPLALLLAFVVSSLPLIAADKIVAGPKGGRMFDTAPHKTEFLVTKDRKVHVNFYDAALKPVARGDQVVSITAEPKSGRTKVELEKTTHGFASPTPLPDASEPYRVVVQVRPSATAKPQNFRVDLNLATCGECKLQEYACTCEGH